MVAPAELDELLQLNNWVVWRYEERNGDRTKVLYCPETGLRAKSTDPSTWRPFRFAEKAVEAGLYDGVGFVFTKEAGLVGVDIDHAFDEEGCPTEAAMLVLRALPSYAEYSPSGNGLHLFIKGEMPGTGRKNPALGVEAYDTGRFFTMTFRPYGTVRPIAEGGAAWEALHDLLFPSGPPRAEAAEKRGPSQPADLSDADLLEKMVSSASGARIARLMAGDTSDYNGDDSSADMALCSYLAWWCDGDTARMDRLFRASGLMRDKWDSKRGPDTYGERTVARAAASLPPEGGYRPGEAKAGGTIIEAAWEDAKARAERGEPEPDGDGAFHLTDLGNARRIIATHGARLRYCKAWGKWLLWDGMRWATDETDYIFDCCKGIVETMQAEVQTLPQDRREAAFKWAMQCESAKRIREMEFLARTERAVIVTPDRLDTGPYDLNCLNGTLDLLTGELRDHDPNDNLSRLCPVAYDPAAEYPTWYKFLVDAMDGDMDLVHFLQRAAGYSLSADTSERCMFVLHGARGKNGKSTFVDALTHILGDYHRNTPTETLMVKYGGAGASSDVARLANVRFVTAAESEEGQRLAESLIKQMTGGTDTITARMLYRDFFDFRPVFKLWFSTNHKPVIRGTDDAIWDRIRMIPFNRRFTAGEQDKRLPAKLRAEASGILAWAVEGFRLWREGGLQEPEGVTVAVEGYRTEMDTMADFYADCCEIGPEYECSRADLFKRYKDWCHGNREQGMSARAFALRIGEDSRFRTYKHNGTRMWTGIAPIPSAADEWGR